MNTTADDASSTNPYSDGEVPEDADFAPGASDESSPEGDPSPESAADSDETPEPDSNPGRPEQPVGHPSAVETALVDTTGQQEPDPDALIRGNRVATAKDME